MIGRDYTLANPQDGISSSSHTSRHSTISDPSSFADVCRNCSPSNSDEIGTWLDLAILRWEVVAVLGSREFKLLRAKNLPGGE
jgi:hypothetical protein